jgi:transcriptional regulator with XRE-family HTH domain
VRLQELGQVIRGARHAHGQTQAQLARAAGISRETLNLLESGLVRDLGIRKVLAVLEALGLAIAVDSATRPRKPDYLRMACTSASTSFRAALTEKELAHALITGKVPAQKRSHLRALLDETPAPLLRNLAEDARKWMKPGKLEQNLHKLVDAVGAVRKIEEWLKTG